TTNRFLSARSQSFTQSVIREMTRQNAIYGGINLAQGFPDFDPPEAIKEAAVRAIREGHNQYAITWGDPLLRQAIAEKVRWYNGIPADPDAHITVTCGATEAMMSALMAVINPGDEVIIFEPFYENYGPDTIISGAQPVYVPLRAPDYTFDRDELAAAFSPATKAIIINTPHNPTGRVFSGDELAFIADLCQQHDALAITDEIYEHILYDGHAHVSIASLPGMFERTITISGISKTYSVTGWRVGYVIAPPEISENVRRVHDFLTVGAPAPLQIAAAYALGIDRSYYAELAVGYQQKRDILLPMLRELGFHVLQPQGAYYLWTDISALTADSGWDFANYLVRDIGVATVPGGSFYSHRALGDRYIRFNFSKQPPTLHAAVERLQRLR
ncbi:MAG TPA: aminotransferase class I/II-fold pyridoxal phosphate-dependent enzyme, partial [Armatimonadota bacterium]